MVKYLSLYLTLHNVYLPNLAINRRGVLQLIRALHPEKVGGSDISVHMILCYRYPSVFLKKMKIFSIPERGRRENTLNYRPISLLYALGNM